MGSGEVTMPVMVSATVGLQEWTCFEMRYTVMFDDGQTARAHIPGKVANRWWRKLGERITLGTYR